MSRRNLKNICIEYMKFSRKQTRKRKKRRATRKGGSPSPETEQICYDTETANDELDGFFTRYINGFDEDPSMWRNSVAIPETKFKRFFGFSGKNDKKTCFDTDQFRKNVIDYCNRYKSTHENAPKACTKLFSITPRPREQPAEFPRYTSRKTGPIENTYTSRTTGAESLQPNP